MKKKKILFLLLFPLLLLVGALSFRSGQPERPSFRIATVTCGDIRLCVTATGTLEPLDKIDISTQVSGTLLKLHADYNTEVKKGDTLALLDPSALQATVAEAGAALKSALNELTYRQAVYVRVHSLYEKGMASLADEETARYTLKQAEAQQEKCAAEDSRARTNLSYSTIISPIDGVVLSRSVNEGQTVAANFSAPTLFTLAKDLRKMKVEAAVDEADIGKVTTNQHVEFTVDAFPEDSFSGIVSQVRLEATVNANVVTYSVIITADNPDKKLLPGMTATLSICTNEVLNVARVPAAALTFRPAGISIPSESAVWIMQQGIPRPVPVNIGLTDGNLTEIRKGVTPGDTVLIGMAVASADKPTSGTADEKSMSPFLPSPPPGGPPPGAGAPPGR
ncbi:MAG: hypothetical protein A2293_13220 [Elusimicrobia bacterium RIFOXYB2_FULL_49_7]|nr:MAG: hypothetical protein A2293_13220 [Elusimicrobia bacterium RIFOXYB2_FULL_49_7]